MVLSRTENTRYNTNSNFGETIHTFQDCNIKNNIKNLEGIKPPKTSKQQDFDFI